MGVVFALVVTMAVVGCQVAPKTSVPGTDARPSNDASGSAAGPSEVDVTYCADYVMLKAYLGQEGWRKQWVDLGQDVDALRTWCAEFAKLDRGGPQRMHEEYLAIQRYLSAAAQPPASPPATVPAVDPVVVSAPPPVPVYEAPSSGGCDPNYGGCVPIASDVDCAGGSGNGPAYTDGPVEVIGSDIYGLDRDGNGWGCD